MGFFGKQLLKVIEWEDNSTDTMVYKFPMKPNAEIMNESRLTVRPSQAAVFVHRGKIADVFYAGEYKLSTRNLPLLTSLGSWRFGFKSPFQAEIYFVNTKQFIDQKWGTKNPIMMRDKDFGMIRLRGFGKFSFKVEDPTKFLTEVMGTADRYTVSSVSNWLSSNLIAGITDQISESKISALDLAANYLEFGESMLPTVQPKFAQTGLELMSFIIENLSLPDDVEKAMDKRTSMGVMSGAMNEYTQYETVQALRDAAKNPSSGGLAGMGMGLGMGTAFGNMIGGTMQGNAQNQNQSKAANTAPCPNCGAMVAKGVKFCPECGGATSSVCPKCSASVEPNAKFCPECGYNLKQKKTCPKCKAELDANAKFCPECGERV